MMESSDRTDSHVHHDSDDGPSMSYLGDGDNRSGEDIVLPMGNTRLSTEVGGRSDIPIATPASSHNEDNNLRSRMTSASSFPRPPMTMASTDAADASNHISPDAPRPPPVSAGASTPPTSAQSNDSRILAALYQSSRRSRTNTPRERQGVAAAAAAPRATLLPPPPPLYAAPSPADAGASPSVASYQDLISALPSQQQQSSGGGGGGDADAAPEVHKVSLRSSTASSFLGQESWNTSFGSLMNSSFMNASSSNFNFRPSFTSQGGRMSYASPGVAASPPLSNVNLRSSIASQGAPLQTTGEGSAAQVSGRQNLMDYTIQDRFSYRRLSAEYLSSATPTPPLPNSTDEREEWSGPFPQPPGPKEYKVEDDNDRKARGTMLTIPTLSADSAESPERPPSVGCVGELSSLQVRSREEFELRRGMMGGAAHEADKFSSASEDEKEGVDGDDENVDASSGDDDDGDDDSRGPPKKKNKMKSSLTSLTFKTEVEEQYPPTPQSCGSSASFDIIAHPSSRVSSIHDEINTPFDGSHVAELLTQEVNITEFEINAEKDHEMGALRMKEESQQDRGTDCKIPPPPFERPREQVAHRVQETEEGKERESPSKKEQRILRRKVQRLLLIRHCTTCPVRPPPLAAAFDPPNPCVTGKDDAEGGPGPVAVCPVTSHCAEGKALCAHIRTCKLKDCTYRKCLTSREVLGHYRACRDAKCEICGPVRALDGSKHQHGGGRTKRRRASDCSSIETIDDEGWLNANMMDGDDPMSMS